ALRRRDHFECFLRGIEAAETQRGGREIELAVEIVRLEARDLGAPRDRLGTVLLLARLRQDVECREGIVTKLQDFPCGAGGAIEIFLCHQDGSGRQQTRFPPAAVSLRSGRQQYPAEAETEEERCDANRQNRQRKSRTS